MHTLRTAGSCLAAAVLSACASSPSGPSGSSPGNVLQGQAVNAVDGSAASGVSVQVGSATRVVMTDSNGYFQSEVGSPGTFALKASSTAIVERHTAVNGPSGDRVHVSLIPTTFDLQSFDQLVRTSNARLQRWTTQPQLVVVARVMDLKGTRGEGYTAISDQMTDDEVTQLVAHLTEGLAIFTGGTYTSFATVDVEHPQPGDRVSAARTGKIVVGRYIGITTAGFGPTSEVIGYGKWEEQSDGRVTGGTVYLDRDFDRDDARRRLLRIHELGHALGYNHVTARSSVMNPSIGPEPSDFDRLASSVAFQRPPGNVSPDSDPESAPRGFSERAGRWVTPIP